MGSDARLRLFFAVGIHEERLVAAATRARERLERAHAQVKWVEGQNLHFTLRFLGAQPGSSVQSFSGVARRVAREHARFTLELRGMGLFPHPRRPRVVWIGCVGGAAELVELAAALDRALLGASLVGEQTRPFVPHLTLGRVKGPAGLDDLVDLVGAETNTAFGAMECEGFTLYRSDLRPSGPVYTALETFPLGEPPP